MCASADGTVVELSVPFTSIDSVVAAGAAVAFVGASPTAEAAVIRASLDGDGLGPVEVVRPPRDLGLPEGLVSVPEADRVPDRRRPGPAYGLFYPPANPGFAGPGGIGRPCWS